MYKLLQLEVIEPDPLDVITPNHLRQGILKCLAKRLSNNMWQVIGWTICQSNAWQSCSLEKSLQGRSLFVFQRRDTLHCWCYSCHCSIWANLIKSRHCCSEQTVHVVSYTLNSHVTLWHQENAADVHGKIWLTCPWKSVVLSCARHARW